jgi:hypothetical protein
LALRLDKSLREWVTDIIARNSDASFYPLCRALLKDVIEGKLVTTPSLTETERQWLRDNRIVEKIGTRTRRWGPSNDPQTPEYWLAKLIVSDTAIKAWRAERGAEPIPVKPQEPSNSGTKRPIPKTVLMKNFQKLKGKGGPVPAADPLVSQAQAEFPNYHITRDSVRTVHTEVWGQQTRGPRGKS